MKIAKSLAAAAVLAAASLGSSAHAADISHGVSGLAVIDGFTSHFGATFDSGNQANTYADRFVFSVFGAPSNLDVFVGNIADNASLGLNLQSLSLYSSGGTLIASGSTVVNGAQDLLTLSADSLAEGNYYLQVNGSVVSNQAASYAGQLALNPVPEPETYGMMLAGLGVLGFLARRRKAANQ